MRVDNYENLGVIEEEDKGVEEEMDGEKDEEAHNKN